MNKQVITRTGGSQLGVVTQLWVDTTRWEVVSLDLRQNLFLGDLEFLLLESLRQVGDVILVHDEDALEPDLSVYGLYTLIGSEVITESGEPLGRVRDFSFEPDSGRVARIHFDALGVPLIPDSVVSSYSLPVEEVVTVGPDRVVVLEGAEARVKQLTASFLQRLAVTVPPWEDSLNYGYLDENYGDYDDWGVQRRPARSQRYDEYDRSGSYLPPPAAREPPRPEYEYDRSGRGGPRNQRSEYDMPLPQRPRPREATQQPSPEPSTASQKKARVRLYGPSVRRRIPADQTRDADGNFGDAVPREPTQRRAQDRDQAPGSRPATPTPDQESMRDISEWFSQEEEREYEMASSSAGGWTKATSAEARMQSPEAQDVEWQNVPPNEREQRWRDQWREEESRRN